MPELRFRKALWARGVRYRLYANHLPGKPDIIVPESRLAIFIDGDFWHGGQWYKRGHTSLEAQFVRVGTASYWVSKILKTMERDRANTESLVSSGWRVLRFWESHVTANLDECIDTAIQAAHNGKTLINSLPGIPERTFAEFFAGIGLVRLALERHGWRTKFANDIDPDKHEMYAANFPDDPLHHYQVEDIHKLTGNDIPTVTLATASFPCTDLSLAGARNGLAGKQSGALLGFLDVLASMGDRRPPIVMLENVPGFLTSRHGADFHTTLQRLSELGYSVDAFVLDAIDFAPQSRQRLFVIGVSGNGLPEVFSELGAVPESSIRPRKLVQMMDSASSVRWRPLNLPTPTRTSAKLVDILEDITHDSVEWWSQERADYLLAQMSERHRTLANLMINSRFYRYGTIFRRIRHGHSMAELRADGIAGCLRTPRGGSSRQILFKAGRGKYWARFLTPRECARLQGAPDSYEIAVPLNQALFGFGDAVCVPVIEWIAEHYLNVIVSHLIRGRLLVNSEDRQEMVSK